MRYRCRVTVAPSDIRPENRTIATLAKIALAILVGALVGCEDRRIATGQLAAAMSEYYGRDAPIAVEGVSCPERVRTKAGEDFRCSLTFVGGVTWPIDVVQGEDGVTRWRPQGKAVFPRDIEVLLRAGHADGARPESAVVCAETVRVLKVGETWTCQKRMSVSDDEAQGPTTSPTENPTQSPKVTVRLDDAGTLQIVP